MCYVIPGYSQRTCLAIQVGKVIVLLSFINDTCLHISSDYVFRGDRMNLLLALRASIFDILDPLEDALFAVDMRTWVDSRFIFNWYIVNADRACLQLPFGAHFLFRSSIYLDLLSELNWILPWTETFSSVTLIALWILTIIRWFHLLIVLFFFNIFLTILLSAFDLIALFFHIFSGNISSFSLLLLRLIF